MEKKNVGNLIVQCDLNDLVNDASEDRRARPSDRDSYLLCLLVVVVLHTQKFGKHRELHEQGEQCGVRQL